MARTKKKYNLGFALLCALIFFVVGAGLGVAGKIFLFTDGGYEIPATQQAETSISQGSSDVEVVKNQDLSIHFLELGNKYTGDCTLIKVGSIEILIDAGSRANSVSTITNYLTNYVEGPLDYVIVTHAHQDHYAGFATSDYNDSIFAKFDCDKVIKFSKTNQKETAKLYQNFINNLEYTETNNGTIVYDALQCVKETEGAQKSYDLGSGISLEILYQTYYENKASTENNYSVCCMINQDNEKYYLFTGDLESDGEASLVDEYYNAYGKNLPECVLYKAGHHGSKTSSSSKLLEVISPEIVCVCCCAGSSEYTSTKENQFPTQQFIDRIAPYTNRVYVTTLCIDYNKGSFQSFNGNIIVSSNSGQEVSVAGANNNTILKDTDWFKQNRICPDAWQ